MTPQTYVEQHLLIMTEEETLKLITEQHHANSTDFLFDCLLYIAAIIQNN